MDSSSKGNLSSVLNPDLRKINGKKLNSTGGWRTKVVIISQQFLSAVPSSSHFPLLQCGSTNCFCVGPPQATAVLGIYTCF